MACPTCGLSWEDKATFCGACGDQLPGSPARSTTPAHEPTPRRDRTRGRWVVAGTIVLVALVAGAAALVGGPGPPRDTGGDDEVAVPDDQDLQQADASTEATAPTVHCIRDDVPVACVQWIRHAAEGGPGSIERGAWRVMVASESLVTVEHDALGARSLGTGEVQWRREFDRPVQTWPLIGDAILLSPSDGRIHALSTDDGTTLWSADGTSVTAERAAADTVYVVNDGSNASRLTARAPHDGSVRWEYVLPDYDEDLGFFDVPQVTAAGPATLLTMGSARHLDVVALDSEDGTERWRRQDSRPVHASDGVAVVVDVERAVEEDGDQVSVSETLAALVGVDSRDGAERWRHELPGTHRSIVPADDVVVVVDDGDVTALDVVTGEERWDAGLLEGEQFVNTGRWWWGRHDSRLTGVLLSVVPRDSLVVARDPSTGELLWRTRLDRPVGDVTTVDGVVVVRTTQDSYVQLDAASGAVLGTVTVEGPGPSMFVAADVLVDPRSGWLVAVDLPPPQ